MEKKKFSELESKEKRNVIIFVGILILIGYWIFKPSSENSEELLSEKYSKSTALIESRQFIEKRLKAPSTADFSYESEKSVEKINDTTFLVTGYVDSENSFGAKLRNNYSCKIVYLDKIDKVRCLDIIIE